MSSRYITKNDRPNLLNQLVLIDEIELTADAADITFYDIPDKYRDLQIIGELKSNHASPDDAVVLNVGDGVVDTGANYRFNVTYISAAGAGGAEEGTATALPKSGWMAGGNVEADFYAPYSLDIIDYASTSRYKHMIGHSAVMQDTTYAWTFQSSMVWQNKVSAVNTLKFKPAIGTVIKAGSRLILYGRGLRDGATVQEIEDYHYGLLQSNPITQSYDLGLADISKVVEVDNGANVVNINVLTEAVSEIPEGAVIEIYQMGTGTVNILPAEGVTVRNLGDIAGQYQSIALRYRGGDEWVMSGGIAYA